jgi:hypothetical protein
VKESSISTIPAIEESQGSRDIAEFAYRQGAVALLNFLDGLSSYSPPALAFWRW